MDADHPKEEEFKISKAEYTNGTILLVPKQKKARRFKEPIFGPSKALERKPYGPGQHGRSRFTKKSEYSVQLEQKQKAKYTYGFAGKAIPQGF